MSLIRTGIAWLKDAVRGVHLDPHWQPPSEAGEVDNLTERYSAKAFIAFQRRCMDGDRTGALEWIRVIRNMSAEDRQAWQDEVDWRICAGELTAVLTEEQMEEVRQRVLARKDEIAAQSMGGMFKGGSISELDIATMHAVMHDPDAFNDVDEDGLPEWPELEDNGWDEEEST